jgi:hypothetical protein
MGQYRCASFAWRDYHRLAGKAKGGQVRHAERHEALPPFPGARHPGSARHGRKNVRWPLLFDCENRYAARAIDSNESFHVDYIPLGPEKKIFPVRQPAPRPAG